MVTDSRQEVFEKIFKEHLRIETYSRSIDSLFSPRMLNRIDYKPYYQRNYVWDYRKATFFIESILLGTEVPPLIFFDNNNGIEVIDGRQRFETIKRFMDNGFKLQDRGLKALKQLKGMYFSDLQANFNEISNAFFDAKLRLIEFKIVNDPPLDKHLEDRVKKEIFSRYNTGITPLKKSEIDAAVYDDDILSNILKDEFLEDYNRTKQIFSFFYRERKKVVDKETLTAEMMTFVRKNLVLPWMSISLFVQGSNRTFVMEKLYEKFSNDSFGEEDAVCKGLYEDFSIIEQVVTHCKANNLESNQLVNACILWALRVLRNEDIKFTVNDIQITELGKFIDENIESYSLVDHAFNKQVTTRYLKTAEYFGKLFNLDFSPYLQLSQNKSGILEKVRKHDDAKTKLSELESLRLNKPEPSRNSLDDISRMMRRRNFLVRPSYQRTEVINLTKASSIIESMLLGISLPALFLFKRENGVCEVIDGQQRILTLMGFIGEKYLDEKGDEQLSKNHNFKLRNLKIMKELNGCPFRDLDQAFPPMSG